LSNQGVHTGVIDMYRLKPVDGDVLIEAIGDASRLVTLEEHSVVGGLGSLVCEILSDRGRQIPTRRLALPDGFVYQYGDRDWLQGLAGLDLSTMLEGVRGWVSQTSHDSIRSQ
jgi:transketolase